MLIFKIIHLYTINDDGLWILFYCLNNKHRQCEVISVFSNDTILWFARVKTVDYGKAPSWRACCPSGDWVSYCKMRGTPKEMFKSILDAHHAPLDLVLLTLAKSPQALSEGPHLHFELMCCGVSHHLGSRGPLSPLTLSTASLTRCPQRVALPRLRLPAPLTVSERCVLSTSSICVSSTTFMSYGLIFLII